MLDQCLPFYAEVIDDLDLKSSSAVGLITAVTEPCFFAFLKSNILMLFRLQ